MLVSSVILRFPGLGVKTQFFTFFEETGGTFLDLIVVMPIKLHWLYPYLSPNLGFENLMYFGLNF